MNIADFIIKEKNFNPLIRNILENGKLIYFKN